MSTPPPVTPLKNNETVSNRGTVNTTASSHLSRQRQFDRRIDLVAALLFIAAAVLVIWVAIPLGVQEPKKVKFAALSPSYYPRLIGYCLLGFGLLLLVRQWLSSRLLAATKHSERPASDQPENGTHSPYRSGALTVLASIAIILFGYFWFLESLGLVLASAIVLVVTQLIAGERSIPVILLIGALVPMLLYLFFAKIANIPIPAGILEPWLLKL